MVKDPGTELATPDTEEIARAFPRAIEGGFFGHPRGLRTLFFTEMWERFSFYGMRAILILFMTAAVVNGGLGFGADKAGPIYAIYTSLAYLATVPGGWIADNLFGQRRSVLWGGFIIMCGHILLALHGLPTFFGGLACIVIGTGLLKPNISVIVGQLYGDANERRDAGFSIFYMGINLGALASPIVCGWLAQSDSFKHMLEGWGIDPRSSWHFGFAAAAVGMFFGLLQYLLTAKDLGEAGKYPTPAATPEIAASRRRVVGISVASVVLACVGLWLVDRQAEYLGDVSYESASEGLVARGALAGGGEERQVNHGKPFAAGDVDRVLGEEAGTKLRLQVLAQEVAAGSASGQLGDSVFLRTEDPEERAKVLAAHRVQGFDLPAEPSPELKKALDGVPDVRLTDVAFSSQGGELVMTAKTLDEPRREVGLGSVAVADLAEGFPHWIGSLRPEIAGAVLADAVRAGRAQGALQDVSVKLGGLNTTNIKEGFKILLLLIIVAFFGKLFLASEWTRSERARLVTIFVLFLGAAVFWGLFDQAGSTLTLFADRRTHNSVFGFSFPSSWWQAVNAIMIVLLAPVFAWLWERLGKRNPSYPIKFAVGLFFAGAGFLVLVGGASAAKAGVLVSPMWLFVVYLLHTIGELWLSPVGLSSMTKLAPARVVSLMMGVWFLATSVGDFMAGSVAGYYDQLSHTTLFAVIATTGFVMAAIMLSLARPIRRMMERSQAPDPRPGH